MLFVRHIRTNYLELSLDYGYHAISKVESYIKAKKLSKMLHRNVLIFNVLQISLLNIISQYGECKQKNLGYLSTKNKKCLKCNSKCKADKTEKETITKKQ